MEDEKMTATSTSGLKHQAILLETARCESQNAPKTNYILFEISRKCYVPRRTKWSGHGFGAVDCVVVLVHPWRSSVGMVPFPEFLDPRWLKGATPFSPPLLPSLSCPSPRNTDVAVKSTPSSLSLSLLLLALGHLSTFHFSSCDRIGDSGELASVF